MILRVLDITPHTYNLASKKPINQSINQSCITKRNNYHCDSTTLPFVDFFSFEL